MTEFSVTQHGKPLDESKYKWDDETHTFSSNEDNLVIDFGEESGITFNTGYECTFTTGGYCTFKTGAYCTFKTGSYCTFTTYDGCTFKTGAYCTFKTGAQCTFNTGYSCTFTTGENCSLIRYDVKGVTEIPEGKTIKLNDYQIEGYTENHTIIIDGKEIQLSQESFDNLKDQLTT